MFVDLHKRLMRARKTSVGQSFVHPDGKPKATKHRQSITTAVEVIFLLPQVPAVPNRPK